MSNSYFGCHAGITKPASEANQEPEHTGCTCRWDKDDNRVATCVRHQGWLDVVSEWADRAKEAESKLANHATVNTALLEALKEAVALRVALWRGGDLEGDDDHLSDAQVAAKESYAKKWSAAIEQAEKEMK